MLLTEIIIKRIKNEGPLSFRDFMEMALYFPELGYYNSMKNKIGEDGDFYTSASLSESFGAMIGRQIEEMWEILDRKPFKIIEYGAGTGLLCRDILHYLKNNTTLYKDLSYCIIEKSESMRAVEKKYLIEKVTWHNSIKTIPDINGCILSNEVIDNFSVHQVVMDEELKEVFVDYDNGFIEVLQPAKKELKEYLKTLKVVLPKGYRTEINLEAIAWIKEVSQFLNKGYIITIDYGSFSSDLYRNARSSGTLLCYNNHQKNENPYQLIGYQDITSHTNFSALGRWGLEYGINYCGMIDQTNFLRALGIKEYQNRALNNPLCKSQVKIHESYINYGLLMAMGMKFKVLIQQKGINQNSLSGLKFAKTSVIKTIE
ncbi:class I SAM-dependent methyltransferase [Flavobacterium sp. WC2430]|uniref:class I SAM-dependent methyltransferase n=1 Tax=Flavobacterium sp. WC2430 TaxID=3234137 RepID=UPI00346746C6